MITHTTKENKMEDVYVVEGCVCEPGVNIWGPDICGVCEELRNDYCESESQIKYCKVCDGGHDGGEFGELCPANGPRWFEPSDPRDLDDQPQAVGTTTEVWW
jgi:hypothetical protein